MMKAWQHFKTITTHKMWVMRYCFKIGLYWQGLTHDLSKYSPTAQLTGVNVPEHVLSAALAKTGKGKTSGLVQGAGAVYMVKVTAETKTQEKFDKAAEQQRLSQTIGQRSYESAFIYLVTHLSKMKDHRYQF